MTPPHCILFYWTNSKIEESENEKQEKIGIARNLQKLSVSGSRNWSFLAISGPRNRQKGLENLYLGKSIPTTNVGTQISTINVRTPIPAKGRVA